MPPTKQVQSLYFQCLNCVFEHLFEEITSGISPRNFERMRKHYVSNLHGGIREHILKLAVLKDKNRMKFLLQLINLLIDCTITDLYTVSGLGFLLADHYSTLITHLKTRKCTGLKSLYIRVLYERNVAKTKDIIIKTNVIFHSLLREGLAKNLTVLVLGRCCDNEILKIIGEHCRHLNKLDIVASWYVNDNGFKYLCLKDPDCIEDISEHNTRSSKLILQLMSIEAKDLNPCCFSLNDVRIQETDTTDLAVLMLLIFLKNLRTLGGFIYFRNVGDNIIFLSRLAENRFKLKFRELYDTHLTHSKLDQLLIAVPDLTAVYTRSKYVQPLLSKFKNLSDITIDFDYERYEDNFFSFLSNSGSQLEKINLIENNDFIDMAHVLELCPNLVQISGSVKIVDVHRKLLVPNLKKVNLRVRNADAALWIINNALNLEHLQIDATLVDFDYNNFAFIEFNNRYLKTIVQKKPACLDTLKYFIIICEEKHYSASYDGEFSKKTIMKFISLCKELRLIGDLKTWSVNNKLLNCIKQWLQEKNLDVTILYDKECFTDITMDNLRELNIL